MKWGKKSKGLINDSLPLLENIKIFLFNILPTLAEWEYNHSDYEERNKKFCDNFVKNGSQLFPLMNGLAIKEKSSSEFLESSDEIDVKMKKDLFDVNHFIKDKLIHSINNCLFIFGKNLADYRESLSKNDYEEAKKQKSNKIIGQKYEELWSKIKKLMDWELDYHKR